MLVIDCVLFNELTNVEICFDTPDRFAADKLVAAVAMDRTPEAAFDMDSAIPDPIPVNAFTPLARAVRLP